MWHLPIVRVDEEGDQLLEVSHGVERVEIEPRAVE
jgi:hypothetical protein